MKPKLKFQVYLFAHEVDIFKKYLQTRQEALESCVPLLHEQ